MSNAVKTARIRKNLTQEECARAANVTVWCVVRYESLGRVVASDEGRRVAKVLGLPMPVAGSRRRGPHQVTMEVTP